MAKLANDISDNLLTRVSNEWNYNKGALIVCPAMNTMMWDHPFTEIHLNALKKREQLLLILLVKC